MRLFLIFVIFISSVYARSDPAAQESIKCYSFEHNKKAGKTITHDKPRVTTCPKDGKCKMTVYGEAAKSQGFSLMCGYADEKVKDGCETTDHDSAVCYCSSDLCFPTEISEEKMDEYERTKSLTMPSVGNPGAQGNPGGAQPLQTYNYGSEVFSTKAALGIAVLAIFFQ